MISDKVLVCPRCAINRPWEWRGYVPYYDEQYVRRFVVVASDYYESICEIKHLSPILISRGPEKTDSVVVKYEPWRTTPIPHAKDREGEVNLIDFLIRVLWKDEALVRFHCRSTDAEEAMQHDVPARVLEGIEIGEEVAREVIMSREKKRAAKLRDLEEKNRRFIEQAASANGNGKHPIEPPG